MQRNLKNATYTQNATRRNQQGVSLIEVLVTVLIIAIGGLGVASLQLAGLKYSSGSYGRTQAIILADDMANRLKSNRVQALNIQADDSYGLGSDYEIAAYVSNAISPLDCLDVTCDFAQTATYDVSSWLAEVSRVLPAGEGRITFEDRVSPDGVTVRHFEIGLRWRQVANSTSEAAVEADEVKEVIYRVTI